VIRRWSRGEKGRSRNMSTDGRRLFSYILQIGFTGRSGVKYVYNFTGHTEEGENDEKIGCRFVSQTTSCHVGLARRFGVLCNPPQGEVNEHGHV